MLKVWVLAAALAVAGGVQAQGTGGKKELVAKVLQLQQPGLEQMARSLAQQPAAMMMQQAAPVLQRLPAERREAVARDIEADVRKYTEEAVPLVTERALKLAPSTIGALLEERFSEDELKQIIAMLESPVNRKFQSMGGDMQRAIGEKLIAETKPQIEPKLRALEQVVSKRLGVTPNGAASAPAAKPATAAPQGKK
ncbi:MAG TPA: hypothetical protein PLA97_13200 [Rubrivivax sp.]|nr:hypothetical protein [Rubrivivax sp.]